jgi:hypothetical protein
LMHANIPKEFSSNDGVIKTVSVESLTFLQNGVS